MVATTHGAALIAGDAAVTAHYRLGAGVNFAVEASLKTLRELLEGSTVEAAAATANARADALVQRQLWAMLWESKCGFVTYHRELFAVAPDERGAARRTSRGDAAAASC